MRRALPLPLVPLLAAFLLFPTVLVAAAEPGGVVDVLWSVQAAPPYDAGWLAADERAVFLAADGWLRARDAATGRILWAAESPAIAHEPAIAHGTIVAARTDGIVVAHDAITGERRWSVEYGSAFLRTRDRDVSPQRSVAGASSLRAYAWESVIVDSNERVDALSLANGTRLWRSDAPLAGPSGNRLITTAAGQWPLDAPNGRTVLTARDAATGATRWERTIDAGPSGPLASGVRAVVLSTIDGVLHAFNATTGEPLWSHDIGRRETGWISADESRAYLVVPGSSETIERRHRAGVHFDDEPRGDTHLLAVDLATGRLVWSYRTAAASLSHVTAENGTVLAAGGSPGGLYAIDAETGALRWKWRASEGGSGLRSLREANGTFLALGTAGRLSALRVDESALPPIALELVAEHGPSGLVARVNATSRASEAKAFAVRLSIDGAEVDARVVELAPGETVALLFEPLRVEAGYHVVEASPALGVATAEAGVLVREAAPLPEHQVAGAIASGETLPPEPIERESEPSAQAARKLPAPGSVAVAALVGAIAAAIKLRARRAA